MNRPSFLHLFPVPKYLQFPAVGFDVSDGSVKFVELLGDKDSPLIGRYGRQTFRGDLEATLSSIQKEYHFDKVNVSIPEEESFFVRIRLPYIQPEEIRSAIELQLEEYIPYPTNDVEFDYEILKTDPRPNGYVDVNVSVLPKKILKSYLDTFRKAKLQPVSLTIEAEATSRAVVPADSKEVVMIVNIGRVNTVLSIITNNSVWVSYTFRFGGDTLVGKLQETCKISAEAAEKVKNEKGLINSPDNQEVFGCILPLLSGVRDEIRKHRRYWSDHRQDFPMGEEISDISRVLLCGSQATIPGFTSYLSTALSLKTELVNPWVNIFDFDNYIPPINYTDSLEYATAIGLALASLN